MEFPWHLLEGQIHVLRGRLSLPASVLLPGLHQEVLSAPLQSPPPLLLLFLLVPPLIRGLRTSRTLRGGLLGGAGTAETRTRPKLWKLQSDGLLTPTVFGLKMDFQTWKVLHLEESLCLGDHVSQALRGGQVLAQVPLVGPSQAVLPATGPAASTENPSYSSGVWRFAFSTFPNSNCGRPDSITTGSLEASDEFDRRGR